MRLYHFTCSDAAPRIRQSGELRAFTQPQLDGRKLIWLTDLDVPTRAQLGLTSHALRCDRMEYRVTVEVDAHRWVTYAREFTGKLRRRALDLNRAPGVLPLHWWVVDVAVPALVVERAR